MLIHTFFRATVLVAVVALSACTISRQPEQGPAPVVVPPSAPVEVKPAPQPEPPPVDPPASAAWGPLLAKAEQATARGDYEQAMALLERAQRIDPDSAEIYLHMAKTYSARGDTAQARAAAERGLLYCRNSSECAALRGYTP